MPAIYKEGTWYGGTAKAEEISIKIGQNDLRLAETVQNIVEDMAPIETNSTNVINSYNIGDLLTHNGILYRVINDITPGDQLIEGTNITRTTITQGVDLTDRVVALENKTQKISQESDTLKVNDRELQINKFFVAGTSTTSNDEVGFLIRKPERSIDVFISGTNAGIYDRTNANWILRSDVNQSVMIPHDTWIGDLNTSGGQALHVRNAKRDIALHTDSAGTSGIWDSTNTNWIISSSTNQNITIPHQVEVSNGDVYASKGLFISGSAASTADQGIRLRNKTRNLLFTTGLSTATASGLYDTNAGNWVFSYNYSNNNTDNYVYAPWNTFIGNTSIQTSRAVRVRNARRDISLHVDTNAGIYDHKDGTGQWIIYASTDHQVYIPHSFHTNAATVSSLTSTGVGGITVTGGHVYITASTTDERVCNVQNTKRNIQLTSGRNSNQAGIYDNGTRASNGTWSGGSWLIYSNTPSGDVYIPHSFHTNATTVSSLKVTGNTILAATTTNALLCGNVVYPDAHGPSIISYGVATRNNRQIGQILDNEGNTGVIFVRANGTATLAKTISYPTSDRRLKENIKITSRSGLDLINKLDVVEFDWKDSKKHWNYGIIAQDAAKIDENIAAGEEKENEYLSIDTLYLVDVLVKATQELSAQVTELKEKIKILEKKIN